MLRTVTSRSQTSNRPLRRHLRRHLRHPLRRALAAAFAMLALTLAHLPEAQARYAAIVMDADSGQVLYEVNADTRNYPASLTKMMTLYLLFEAMEEGRIKPDQALPVSRRAAGMPASKLGLRRGQSIKAKDAVLALVTKSANDVAVVVAEALAGTEAEFARLMTRKAEALGMARTSFRNASGLPNRGQLSTARDMATLSRALMRDFPGRYKAFATRSFSYNGRSYRNHNKLLRSFAGTDGLKTGYISASGYNLAASAKRDGHRVIAVVFGGKTARSRDRQVTKLLDRGFRRLSDPIYLAAGGALEHDIAPPPAKPLAVVAARIAQTKAAKAQAPVVAGGPAGWGVQVGAFYSYGPAQKAAETARARVPDLLADARLAITHISGQRGKIYRARLIDLTESRARQACQRLESLKNDCLVIQSGRRVELAQNAPD